MNDGFLLRNHPSGSYLSSFHPFVRLVAAASSLAVVLWADPNTGIGLGLMLLTAAVWLLLTWPTIRVLRRSVVFSLFMFSPVFLFAFFDPPTGISSEILPSAMAVPWKIFVRGTVAFICLTATWTTFDAVELEEALNRLPLPRSVIALIVQILHQAQSLIGETRQVGHAVALRASSRRFTFALARGLATGWMIRMLFKADRITTAMEVRGYEVGVLSGPAEALGGRNIYGITISLIWLLGVVVLQALVRS